MRGCSGKVKHRTRAAAEAAMQEVLSRVIHIGGKGLGGWPGVYRCGRCGFWHWGHSTRPPEGSGK